MYPFPPSVTPALRSHLDAQTDFINDVSKSIFQAFEQACKLNIQLAQTLLEETTLASKQVMGAERHADVLGAAAARAQPATDKLRSYQHSLTRLVTESQVELARVAEQHAQNTTRSAREVVDEVARHTAEEAERHLRMQQEALRAAGEGAARSNGAAGADGADPRHAGDGGRHVTASGQSPGAAAEKH